MAGLHFDITGDNSNLLRKLDEVHNGVRSTSKQIEESGMSIEQMFGRMTKGAAAFGAGITVKEIGSSIVRVRGEFQQLEVAFNTMLGSEQKATSLMQQLVKTAATTPFDLQSVAKGAKQLLAYGSNVDNVNNELITLGNVAAGVSVPLGDLVYLYGTLRSQGRAYSVDIRQFAGRGVPIYAELAKVMGVNVEKVNALIEAGKVGFPQVEQAFKNMTSAGGMFNNLMQEQSKTITGQMSNIGDSISVMYNNLGKSSEGVINDALSGVSYLVENYEQVGKTVLELTATYGAYKAVLISVVAIQQAVANARSTNEAAELIKLLSIEEQARISKLGLAKTSSEYAATVKAEVAAEMERQTQLAVLSNQEVAAAKERLALRESEKISASANVASKEAELNATIASVSAETTASLQKKMAIESEKQSRIALKIVKLQEKKEAAIEQARHLKEIGASLEKTAAKNREIAAIHNKVLAAQNEERQHSRNVIAIRSEIAATADSVQSKKIHKVQMELETAQEQLNSASVARNSAVRDVCTKRAKVDMAVRRANTIEMGMNTAAQNANTASTSILTAAKTKLAAASKALGLSMLANPYVLASAAVAGLAYGIYKLATAETDAEEAIRTTNESLEIQKKHYDDLKSKSSELSNILTNESKSIEERFIAYRQLQRLMPSVFKDMDFETSKRLSNADAIKLETDEILRQQRIGLKTKVVMSEQKIQGLRRSITETDNRGGYTGALKEDLNVAQKELEIYQEALKDFEGAKNESEKSKNKLVVQNKSYWENLKKETQSQLDALTDIEASGKKGAALKQKIAEYDKKINSFSASKTTSQENQAAKSAESLRQQQEKYSLLMDKQTLDRKRQQQDLENQAAQAEIDALDDSFEKKDRQRKLNNKKEIQALERQKEDYIRAYIQAEKEKFDAEEELKAKQKKGYIRKTFDPSTVKVDASAFDGIIGNTSKKQLNDKVREHEDSWNEYLIKFGNYQQKRAAIIEKYDKLIKEAGPAGDVATLEKDKQNAIDELDNSIKNSATLMGQLFADASQKSANEIQNVIEKAELLMQYLESVKDEQGNAQIGGKAVSKKDILGLGVSDNTLKNLELSTKEVEALRNAIEKLKGELGGKSPFKLFETQIDSAIKKINQGGKKNISQGITEIGSAVTSFSPAVSQFGKDLANIVGNDEIGSKISGIADAIGGLGTTAMGVGKIMSGDVVGGAMSVISGISSVVSALDGLFGADYSRYNEMKDQYEALNDIWDELIEKKKEYIDISYGVEASKAGEEAKTIQQKAIESYRTLGLERLNSGASAGSHSIGVRIRKGMSSEGWNQAKNALGDEFYNKSIGDGRMEGLFNLSIEQLKKLKEDAPIFWTKLDGDVQDYLNKIIAGSEEIDEINQKIQEQLTQTSFDNVFDSFMDTLMDMDSSAKDFSDDFGVYMKKAVLMNMLGPEIQEKLKAWYQDFSNDMAEKKDENGNIIEKAGVLTDKELKARKEGWDKIVQEGIAERDALFAAMGWESDTSRKATQKGIATASQDSVDENNGRLTMIQGHTYSINESVTSISGNTAKIVENLACMTNISQSMKSILDMKDIELKHLSDISRHTENLVEMRQLMYSMKLGIERMNDKGLKLQR